MTFKLNKRQQTSINEAIKAVEEKKSELSGAVLTFNEKVKELFGEIEEKDGAFTKSAATLRSMVERIVDDWRTEWDGKSGRWQDSEKGEAVSTFIEGWETFARGLPEVSLEKPEPLEVEEIPDMDDMPIEAVET
jgi:hypothetical protein